MQKSNNNKAAPTPPSVNANHVINPTNRCSENDNTDALSQPSDNNVHVSTYNFHKGKLHRPLDVIEPAHTRLFIFNFTRQMERDLIGAHVSRVANQGGSRTRTARAEVNTADVTKRCHSAIITGYTVGSRLLRHLQNGFRVIIIISTHSVKLFSRKFVTFVPRTTLIRFPICNFGSMLRTNIQI